MMNFSVKLSGLSQGIGKEQNIISNLTSLESNIRVVRRNLNFQGSSRAEIQNALKQLADEINGYEADMRKMHSVLQNIHDRYEKTERRLCGHINDHPISSEDIWDAFTTVGIGFAVSAINPFIGLGWLTGEILKDEEWEPKIEWGGYKQTIWDKWDKDKKDNLLKEHYERKDGKWVKTDEKESSAEKTKTSAQKRKDILESITIFNASIKKEGSLLHLGKDGDVETDWGNYSYSADIMEAEAKGSLQLTLGNLGAELGVSLTAFSAEASTQLGNDMLGLHGSANVEVGKAEASGKVSLGWLDEDGNLDLSAKAKLSLEAIAAEASVKGGIDIAGTELNVKGAVNFGLGAHLDVGFDEGKFTFDMGASLGLGGSVKLELDVSGTVDMVVEHAADIGDAAVDAYNAATEFVENAADTVCDFVGDMSDGIGSALNSGWSTFKGWFGG